MIRSPIACEGSGEPALFEAALFASDSRTATMWAVPAHSRGETAVCTWCKQNISINLSGNLARHYPPVEYDIVTKGPSMVTSNASDTITAGQVWESIRERHNGVRVKVLSINPNTVNVRVVEAGASQNNRKIRGKAMHIGRSVFTAHYAKLFDNEAPRPAHIPTLPTPTIQPNKQIQEQPREPVTITAEKPTTHAVADQDQGAGNGTAIEPAYDFKIDELLERTVRMLKRRGWAEGIKTYVLSQQISGLLNAHRTRQLIERGVKLGLIETWDVPVSSQRPGQSVQMVGLPGSRARYRGTIVTPTLHKDVQATQLEETMTNTPSVASAETLAAPKIDRHTRALMGAKARWANNTSPVNVVVTATDAPSVTYTEAYRKEMAERARQNIQHQYDSLTPAQRDEIALLSMDNVNVQALQAKFHVMGAVIGRIKRENGMLTGLAAVQAKKKKSEAAAQPEQQPTVQQLRPIKTPTSTKAQSIKDILDNGRAAKTPAPTETQSMKDFLDGGRAAFAMADQERTGTIAKPLNTYSVTVMVMLPTEQTITVEAASISDAEAQTLRRTDWGSQAVLEVLDVHKTPR